MRRATHAHANASLSLSFSPFSLLLFYPCTSFLLSHFFLSLVSLRLVAHRSINLPSDSIEIKSIFDETRKCAQQFNQRIYITKYIHEFIRGCNWRREKRFVLVELGEKSASIDKRTDEDFRFRRRELIKTIDASRRPATPTRICARVCVNGIVVKRAVSCVPLSSAFLSGSW